MNRPTQALLALLQAGINNTTPHCDAPFPLTADEWNEVLTLAQHQTVSGYAFAGVERLPDHLMPPDHIIMHWVAKVENIEQTNQRITSAQASLLQFFKDNHLHPIVQKGLGVARHYHQPQLRESGDIDLYFAPSEWQAATQAIKARGLNPESRPDRSWIYLWNGIEVEHHPTLLDLSNPLHSKYCKALIDGQPTQQISDVTGTMTVPSPLIELLLINAHIMKHAFGVGIGLRQICDYAAACQNLHSKYSANDYATACRKFGISRWTALLHTFCTTYLGTDPNALPPSGCKHVNTNISPNTLFEIIIQGGNFGQYHAKGKRTYSTALSRKIHTAGTYLRRLNFSLRLAPAEAICTALQLATGQHI